MKLETFVKNNHMKVEWKNKIANKKMKKYINQFKYIDTYIYWYDDEQQPNTNTWLDIEGIGYGWLWLVYKQSEKLQRKAVIKEAMKLYKIGTNKICMQKENDIISIFLESKYKDAILKIRVSNKELHYQL
mgnify:FL=1